MKRILAILLIVITAVVSLPFTAAAKTAPPTYPVVLVPGYASASLCYTENGKTKTAWGWKLSDFAPGITENIEKIFKSAADLVQRNQTETLVQTIAECLGTLLEPMQCRPDGTSVKDVRPVLTAASQTCDSYLNETYPDGAYRVELDMTAALDALIGEENVFYFNCDFRQSAIDCAAALDQYITDVKAYAHTEKVNLVAVSHGGLITAAYLALYPEKTDVYNVVMDEPALAGAGIAADLIDGICNFDEEVFLKYLEYHAQCETDYHWLVKAQQLGFLDEGIRRVVPKLRKAFLYWGSIWDFMPPEVYDTMKAKYLDADASAALIGKSDYVHRQIMPHYREIFQAAQKRGIRVNIIAGAGNRILTGTQQNADGIITAASSTGADCAPFGSRFSDAYVQWAYANGHTISPSMDMDTATCYLPDNTWFINGMFHGMEFWDVYSRDLLFRLLLTPTAMTVHSDPAYPQFYDTTSVTTSAYLQFAEAGKILPTDDVLTVTNTSQKYTMYLLCVKVNGVDLDFSYPFHAIPAGEQATIQVSGALPAGVTYAELTVTYLMLGSATPLGQRKQSFTVINEIGTPAAAEKTFVPSGFATDFEQRASGTTLRVLDKLGLRDFAAMVYDAASTRWTRLAAIFTD